MKEKPRGFIAVGIAFAALSVIMAFSFMQDIIGGDFMLLYPITVLVLVGAGLLIAGFKMLGKIREIDAAAATGMEGTGKFLRKEAAFDGSKGTAIRFSVVFTFENFRGEIVEVKSLGQYSESEADALSAMGTFPIKYIGNTAAITADLSSINQ